MCSSDVFNHIHGIFIQINIIFADKTFITVKEDDLIIPIVLVDTPDGKVSSLSQPIELYNHVHDGLIPALMNVLCSCSFFYLANNTDIAYGTGSIIKIENL